MKESTAARPNHYPERLFSDNRSADTEMDDLTTFIEEQKASDRGFADGVNPGDTGFRIGTMLKQARLDAGMSQVAVAEKLNTHKSAISRMENHAEYLKLSTLTHYAEALGKTLIISKS